MGTTNAEPGYHIAQKYVYWWKGGAREMEVQLGHKNEEQDHVRKIADHFSFPAWTGVWIESLKHLKLNKHGSSMKVEGKYLLE